MSTHSDAGMFDQKHQLFSSLRVKSSIPRSTKPSTNGAKQISTPSSGCWRISTNLSLIAAIARLRD